ncbi:MAG: lysine--tRNA ligase [Nitrososphaerales archaeon]
MSIKIGRGTWLDKVASKVIEREKQIGRSLTYLRVESGLGASGIPHVGSLSDAVRAYGVKLALEDMGFRSELIAYSDDFDGLRKVPAGLPKWLEDDIGKPVTLIQDPFGCHRSYGVHMSAMLLDALDRLSIEYTFQSGAEAYQKGLLNGQIQTILNNAQKIGQYIAEVIGQKKFEQILPYYPLCERCGRLYVAVAYSYNEEKHTIAYRCEGAEIGGRWVKGCGHEGELNVLEGKGKLSWKGEMAARWAAFDIRFEAYGKDIADSVKVNDWISDNILNHPHPYHIRYELFLDKSGRKISKSVGNVFTPQTWLRYGSPQSLLLLMFKRVIGTRSLSVEDVPNYMDEYDMLEDVYFGVKKIENPAELRKMRGLYEYVNLLKPPAKPSTHIPYRLLTQLASVAPKESMVEFVSKKLAAYGFAKEVDEELKKKILLAANWAEDFTRHESVKLALSEEQKKALAEVAQSIRALSDAQQIQNSIFEAAKRNGLKPQELFKTLYQILISSDRGPRLGPYIVDIGRDKAAELIEEVVKGA